MRTLAFLPALFLFACSQGTPTDPQPMNGGGGNVSTKSCCSETKAAVKADSCCAGETAVKAADKKDCCAAEKEAAQQCPFSAAKAGECDKAGKSCPAEAVKGTEPAKAESCCPATDAQKTEKCDKAEKSCPSQKNETSSEGACPLGEATGKPARKSCCDEAETVETSVSGGAAQDPAGQQVVDRQYLKPAESRTFAIEYTGKVGPVPAGTKKLRIWMPVPQDTTVQTIRGLSFSQEPKIGTESKYGNKIAYWEVENPGANFEVTMKFACTRLEIVTDLGMLASEGTDPAGSHGVFRNPDKLVLVDDQIRKMADEICQGRKTTVDKARAIYDYVLKQMTYDKNHEGWGQGSTRHACEVGKGNCTDFHALFNSLCRAQGIASGFEIGLYLPYDRKKDEKLGGYHCWAFFRVPGKTWVPVDASEADRFPDRASYFFGSHTSNRVTLSTGRDITLEPKQDGEAVNYLLNPYAEADGKSVKTDKAWTCKDLD